MILQRIAIFRGAFFGVDHQQALEFELWPEACSISLNLQT